jgi:PD-(D/E)XK endonuclease
MSVLIGDLMAAADEEYGPGGRKKKRGKRGGEKKKKKARGEGDYRSEHSRLRGGGENRFLTGPSARFGMTKGPESLRPESLRKAKWLPPKRMGELSELDFLRKTMGMGMIVSKPWGDSYRYDFVCDTCGRLWRVQVRSTDERFGHRGYAVHASVYVGRKIVGLTEKDIDVIVAYIVSRDIWYVVPVKAFVPRKNLWFYPDGSKKGAMFEKYREAWWVMMGKK